MFDDDRMSVGDKLLDAAGELLDGPPGPDAADAAGARASSSLTLGRFVRAFVLRRRFLRSLILREEAARAGA